MREKISISIREALRRLGNRSIGLRDPLCQEAAKVISDNRDEISGVQNQILQSVETGDGKITEVVFDDPKLLQVSTDRGPIVIFDARSEKNDQ